MSEADGSDDEHTEVARSDMTPLEAEVQGKLGEKLREVYSDVIDAPVPDRFLELLAQLDAKSDPSKKGGDAE